jgi:hypothetical protein
MIIDITTKNGRFQTDGTVSLYGGNHDTIKPSFTYDGSNGVTHHLVSDDYCHEALGSGVGVGAALWPRRDVFWVLARRSVRSSSCEGHHPAAPGRYCPFGRSSYARRSAIRTANSVERTPVRSALRDWTGCASAAQRHDIAKPVALIVVRLKQVNAAYNTVATCRSKPDACIPDVPEAIVNPHVFGVR